MSPIVVQGSDAPRHARTSPSRSRSAARSRAIARAHAPAGAAAAVATGAGTGQKESAFGHVDGVVATRSGTGTKTDAALVDTPVAISVVTQDQIKAQGVQSVSQAVRYSPGVRSEVAGADARFDNIYIRGFVADQYLDSLKLPYFGIFAYPVIEPFNLERVEILHGPASVLYGQSSPGGLVDLVSKRPTLEPYHEMFFSTGSYGRAQGGVDLSGPIDKNKEFLYRVTASGFDVGSQVDHTEYQRFSIAPSLTWRPDNDTTLTVLSTYQRDPKAGFYNQLLPNGIGTITPYKGSTIPTSFYSGEPSFDKTDRTLGMVGYQLEHSFSNNLKARQNVRYMDLSTDFAVVSPNSVTDPTNMTRGAYTTQETIRSINVDNQVETRFNAGPFEHTVLAGLDYLHAVDQRLNGALSVVPAINALNPVYGVSIGPVPYTNNVHQSLDQLGVYAQDQIKYDHWIALLGLRHDLAQSRTDTLTYATGTTAVAPKSDTAVTKRAALLYKFDSGIAPYIQYTESFQPTAGTTFAGSPFAPTTGQQEEVGIKYQPNAKSLYTIAAYNLIQQNVLTPDTDPTHGVGQRVQTGEIRSRGIELEAKTEVNRELTVLASYTYLDNIVTRSNTATQLGKHPVGMPMNSASAWADYTFHGGALDGFGLSGGVRYVGETPGTTANTFYVPAVTLFDASLHYDFSALGPMFKGYSAQINATNIFDKTYVTLCQDIGCYYGLRRNVIATLRYKW
ncbi:TonB-dependent siderophore receptor [Bradyrhizobium sp. CCGUVB4N]|uniref:TonB-dependent siderophore receptor n=1 Tax=Bradyrhizobium sp. CCGUVB4N TaxID=2949631 RepID=UPI0020B21892|nr:TonB-dependent siderophore receptor [Bradyrhizobium sp. CCGUVB4N]MCP3385840.1 TonB-dependent siderophore receptor [Bradyrhizobium sp. CCGUVB4N]